MSTDIERLREALKPFADAVFNDNGDCTVNSGFPSYNDFIRAYFVYRRVQPATEPGEREKAIASRIAADVLANDHVRHLLDEQQQDELHGEAQASAIRALSTASPPIPEAGKVPTGWRLVPVEPTEEMIKAVTHADWTGHADLNWQDGYKIMLSASPLPPAPAQDAVSRQELHELAAAARDRRSTASHVPDDLQQLVELTAPDASRDMPTSPAALQAAAKVAK